MGYSNIFSDSIVEKWLPESPQEIVGFLTNLGTISGILYPVIRIICYISKTKHRRNSVE